MHNKLIFVLCRTCGETLNQGDCIHNSNERSLVGTWTMDEVRKAVEKGYIILDMYELWEYEMETYEKGGLFSAFINKFLKLKQEASGYPSWCLSEEDKDRYIEDYFKHEGVLLEKDKIQCKNSGLRSLAKLILNSFWGKFRLLAKLMLNSFWGRFGQRENQTKAAIVREPNVNKSRN